MKNHASKTHQCVRRLDARFKLAITGTPMENNLMELWSLLSITAPGLFPSPKGFTDYFRKPIESGSDKERLAVLRRRIKPVMLRRTKGQVAAELPPKQEQVLISRPRCQTPTDLRHPNGPRAPEGARATRRLGEEPVSGLSIVDAVAAAQPPRRVGRRVQPRRRRGEGRLPGRAAARVGGRRAQRAGLQPVHRIPRHLASSTGRGRHQLQLPGRIIESPPARRCGSTVSGRAPTRCS